MIEKYNPKFIEAKWQKFWEENKTFSTPEDVTPENKCYVLPQLPYPSGSGLHVGHAEVYTACDIYARYQRMKGKKVLQVFGLDSFGLPAENYAIKTNVHPKQTIDETGANFMDQVKKLGASVDWDRFVRSSDPGYYKFTQWFFLLMYERGLAYRKKQAVNWCESCKTVLANAQVEDGHCERCDTVVVQKDMEQWYLKITDYADKLLEGLDRIDWPAETIKRQKDWIGKSEGTEIEFRIQNSEFRITVFTTRPDTLFGATYMVLAPEGEYIQQLKNKIENWDEVSDYIEETSKKTDLDRQVNQEKTGVELKGIKAVNPANGEEIPVWIADYVIATYGTGAIMAVPAHDERDFAFAKKFGLKITPVVLNDLGESRSFVMGLSENDVKDFGGEVIEKTEKGFFKIIIPYDRLNDYKEFIRVKMEPKFWNEFSTTDGFYFIFKHEDGRIEEMKLTKGTNDLIDGYGMTFNGEEVKEKTENVYSWLAQNSFYEQILIHTEPGIAINSGFLNGLTTAEAKSAMIDWLEKEGKGKRKVQYKLRDWSVSRQRFWGAPLPMLVNEKRSVSNDQRTRYVFIHGYGGSSDSNFFPWLKSSLQAAGHEVTSLDLPNTNKPNVQRQASFVMKQVTFDEQTVIVAHSLGGRLHFVYLSL